MSKNQSFILFLNNRYQKKSDRFYLNLLDKKTAVAVDGGIRFFIRNKIYPDLLVGDFDSAPKMSKRFLSNFDVIQYPSHKDKTDIQLALEYVLKAGAASIDICGGVSGYEIDHTLGNIFLLELVNSHAKKKKCKIKARLIDPGAEIFLLENDSITLFGRRGDKISIIPIASGVSLNFTGLEYPPPSYRLKFGDSLTLRNSLKGNRCRIDLKGRAVIVKFN